MDHPTSAELKVCRAEEHLRTFQSEVTEYVGTADNPVCRVVDELKPKGEGRYDWVFRVEIFRTPPPRLSVLVGDILFSLRSALDHLANSLAVHHVGLGGDLKGTEFPIFSDQKTFFALDRRGKPQRWSGLYKIMSIGPDAQAIIKELQPYHRGNDYARHPLWRLHDLCNIDKHRSLNIVQAPIGAISIPTLPPGLVINSRQVFSPRPLVNGAEIVRCDVTFIGDVEVQVRHQVPAHVAFEEGSPVDDLYAGEALQDIIDYIKSTLFARLYVRDLWQ